MARFELTVNGEQHVVEADPGAPLLTILRNDLGLTAAKLGCGLEQCGACTVLLAGEATLACGLALSRVGAREVTTLEGLGAAGELHPLQRAFVAERAAQCGYCVPGVIVSAAALLAWNANPDDEAIRRQLAGNLCRCGAHPRILAAVKRAARELADG